MCITIFYSINWFGVLIATILYFIIGALWYNPAIFGKIWMMEMSFGEKITFPHPITFVFTFISQFVMITVLNAIMNGLGLISLSDGILFGSILALGIIIPILAIKTIYSQSKWSVFIIDAGYHLVGMAFSGLILRV